MTTDAKARKLAIDPYNSYIVQAPAGSGKTEILTQRYLRLLGIVKNPEEIVALSFTKKAANEMYRRIYNALKQAYSEIEPDEDHKKETYHLAKNALLQSKNNSWDLLKNPKRMNITTIDSFCQSLTASLSLEDPFSLSGNTNPEPDALYDMAIEMLIENTNEDSLWSDSFKKTFLHLDNDTENFKELLISMLRKREQWLDISIGIIGGDDSTKRNIEKNFKGVITNFLLEASNLINLSEENKNILTTLFNNIYSVDNTNFSPDIENIDSWNRLVNIFMNNKGEYRKSSPKIEGLTKNNRKWIKELIATYADQSEEIIEKLYGLKNCVTYEYAKDQFDMLYHICYLAYIASGYLKVAFKQLNQNDFNEVSIQASQALGEESNPTDLALYLDNSIKHILIDEFQDTSSLQFGLFTKLVTTWQEGDGHSIFIVGDPMQSIYLFRQANVNLFLQARDRGIGQIKLKNLVFKLNFRSNQSLVEWFNKSFDSIFPKKDNRETGGIRYEKSISASDKINENAIELCHFETGYDEARYIVNEIQNYLADNPNAQIAILVRSRNHLKQIVPLIKKNGILITENKLENLANADSIKDLVAITMILSNPYDNMYWISLLQSPLFGFILDEIEKIITTEHTIFENLISNKIGIDKLKPHHAKLLQFTEWMHEKSSYLSSSKMTDRIQTAWHLLDGEVIYNKKILTNNYFELLARHLNEDSTYIKDAEFFKKSLDSTFQSSNSLHNVQAMTMHGSKGLEFDFVIIPHMGAKKPPAKDELFLYENYQSETDNCVLLSPIKSSYDEASPSLYEIIKSIKVKKEGNETRRLLYVAVTRAKQKLLLTAYKKRDSKGNVVVKFNKDSLGSIMPLNWSYNKTQENIEEIDKYTKTQSKQIQGFTDFEIFKNQHSIDDNTEIENPELITIKAHVGTIMHRIFECYSNNKKLNNLEYFTNQLLHEFAIPENIQKEVLNKAMASIKNTQEKYPWILNSKSQSEVTIYTQNISMQTQKYIVDLIIKNEDDNEIFIIDYKFSEPANNDSVKDFVDKEVMQYERQLRNYYYAFKKTTTLDIRTYLYFPLLPFLAEIKVKN